MRNSCWFFLYHHSLFIWIINVCNSCNLCAPSVISTPPHPLVQWTISRVRLGWISVTVSVCCCLGYEINVHTHTNKKKGTEGFENTSLKHPGPQCLIRKMLSTSPSTCRQLSFYSIWCHIFFKITVDLKLIWKIGDKEKSHKKKKLEEHWGGQ